MSKFNKDDFPLLFAEVAKVLGDEEAEKQLSIAWEWYGRSKESFLDSCLSTAFVWSATPQGSDYWNTIEYGASPNE